MPPGSQKPTDDQLKDQCEQEFDSLKQQVMQFLISAEWIQQEADARDIEVTDEEVQKQFEDQKNQSFPNEKDYQQFLKTSGQTEEDLLFRVKLDVLSNKVREEIIEGKGDVSDEDIEKYYDENKERFAQPERRDLNVVLTKTEAKANEAKQALESGQSFKDVAKEFSIDEASKSQGGKLPAVAKGQQEKAFDDAIFAAEKGELTGPVKTQFGWYVFEVDKVTAGVAAVARGREGDDQEPAQVGARAEGARQLHRGLPREVQGRDAVRRRLRRRGLRQRVDERDVDRPRVGRRAAGRAAAGRRAAPQGQPVPVPQGARRRRAHRRRAHRRRASRSPFRRASAADARYGAHLRSAAGPRRDHPPAAARVPVGPRAGRALDRAAHGRGGLRAGRRRARRATTRSCSTSWATSCSRSTSCRSCSRSATRAAWPRWPTAAARS